MSKIRKNIIWDIIPFVIIAAAVFIIFYDVIVNNMIISGGDMMPANYPSHTVYAEELKQFKIALWNPYVGFGYPSFAELVSSMLHPINLICFFFLPLGLAMTYSLILCTFFCGIFMYIYAREINMSRSAGIICAFAFSLGYSYIGHFCGMGTFAKSIMFLPLLMFFMERFLKNTDFKNITLLSIGIMLVLIAGHPQGGFYCLLSGGLYFMLNIVFCRFSLKKRGRLLIYFIMVVIIALSLSAIQLLPSYELRSFSVRSSAMHYTSVTKGYFDLRWFKYFLRPTRATSFYIGILPIFLFPIGLFAMKRDKRTVFYLIICMFFVMLACGRYFLFMYKILFLIPGFGYFRYCYRFIYPAIFFFIIVSGKGVDVIIDIIKKVKLHRFFQKTIVCFMSISIPLFLFIDLKKANDIAINVPPTAHPNYEKIEYKKYLEIKDGSLLKFLRNMGKENRLMRIISDINFPPDHHLPENILAQFKIPDYCRNTGAYVALNFSSVESLANQIGVHKHFEILDSLGIDYLVTYNDVPYSDSWKLVFNDLDRKFNRLTETWVDPNNGIYVYKNTKAIPRVFMISDLKEDLVKYEDLQTDKSLKYDIKTTKNSSDHMVFKTKQNKDAYLVLNDVYYPGWKAFVDGHQSRIFIANRLFRAIKVPQGSHIIEFVYKPYSYFIGKCITLFTALLLILFFIGKKIVTKGKK